MTATAQLLEHVEASKTKRSKRSRHLPSVVVAMEDAKARAVTGDWESASGSTLVGLYAWCHQMVYGIVPSELETTAVFRMAAKAATRAQHTLYKDDPSEVVQMIRWAWGREKRLNAWAQRKSADRGRLNWMTQFSRSMQTDYRIALATARP